VAHATEGVLPTREKTGSKGNNNCNEVYFPESVRELSMVRCQFDTVGSVSFSKKESSLF
jgi:hypothetical protein